MRLQAQDLLRDGRITWGLALVFVAVGFEAALRGRYFHDEGVLSWYFASLVRAEPVAGLFFQKLRPTMALVYAPIAPLGFRVFTLVHTLVAAAAIPMIAAIARKFEHRAPNVAALVLASSPLYLAAAPSGQSNVDGVVGLILAAWLLYVRERPAAAGVVLSSLLLIRSELAVFVVAMIGARLWTDRRDLGILIGAAAVPLVYGLAGAVYHQDLLWMVRFPPALPSPAPDAHWREGLTLGRSVAELGPPLLALSPALPLALFVRRAPGWDERALGWGVLVYLCAIRGLPLVGLFNFDTSPRYLLCALPGVALLVSREVDDSYAGRDEPSHAFPALVLLGLGVAWLSASFAQAELFVALIVASLVLAARRAGRPKLALAGWLAPALISVPLLLPATKLRRSPQLDLLTATWTAQLAEHRGPVVTNWGLVRPWLEFVGVLDGERTPVRFIIQADIAYELDHLLDAEVGQREALFRRFDQHFYAPPVGPEQLVPEAWPPGTVVVFINDVDLADTLDLDRWRAAMTVFAQDERLVFGRLHEAAP